jgi:hypothetical protein
MAVGGVDLYLESAARNLFKIVSLSTFNSD